MIWDVSLKSVTCIECIRVADITHESVYKAGKSTKLYL